MVKFDELKDGEKFVFASIGFVKVMEESTEYNAVVLENSNHCMAFAGGELCERLPCSV